MRPVYRGRFHVPYLLVPRVSKIAMKLIRARDVTKKKLKKNLKQGCKRSKTRSKHANRAPTHSPPVTHILYCPIQITAPLNRLRV